MDFTNIKDATFIIDSAVLRNNITDIQSRIPSDIVFRPHFKTHNNHTVGEIFKDAGVTKITVSSISMAEKFANIGFKDILIAFPINVRNIEKYKYLSYNFDLSICVSCVQAAEVISNYDINCNVYIEIDTGDNRSGIFWNSINEIKSAIELIKKNKSLSFKGFLTHNGAVYRQADIKGIINSAKDSNQKMLELKNIFREHKPIISVGDTPSCYLLNQNDFIGIDELRPGNFVYFDLMQISFGVCTEKDIAAKMYCPVVDINYHKNQVVIHGGAVHFSKESIIYDGQCIFGKAIRLIGKEVYKAEGYLIFLSQEHGILSFNQTIINKIKLGDLIEIIPVHSCLTANLMKEGVII